MKNTKSFTKFVCMKPRHDWTKEDYMHFRKLQIELSNRLKPYYDRLFYVISITPMKGFIMHDGGRLEQLPYEKKYQDIIDTMHKEIESITTKFWENY